MRNCKHCHTELVKDMFGDTVHLETAQTWCPSDVCRHTRIVNGTCRWCQTQLDADPPTTVAALLAHECKLCAKQVPDYPPAAKPTAMTREQYTAFAAMTREQQHAFAAELWKAEYVQKHYPAAAPPVMETLRDDDLISHVFDARISGRLARWDYTTIGQLRELADEDLWDIRGVGPQSIKHIREVIPHPDTGHECFCDRLATP